VQARIEPDQMVVTCHTGRVVFTTGQYINAWGAIVVEPDGAEQDLMALIQSTGEGGRRVTLGGLALTDCGTRLFVRPWSHDVYAIDLEANPPTIEAVSHGGVMTHGPIMDMTAAGRDHVFVLGMMQLAWFRRGATGWEQAAAVPVKKGIQVVATTTAEGPAAVAVLSDTKARVQIFALRAGGFTPIGKFAEPVQWLEARGSHLLVRLAGGRLEVAGLAEALGLQR
jgi:hypothetical protein